MVDHKMSTPEHGESSKKLPPPTEELPNQSHPFLSSKKSTNSNEENASGSCDDHHHSPKHEISPKNVEEMRFIPSKWKKIYRILHDLEELDYSDHDKHIIMQNMLVQAEINAAQKKLKKWPDSYLFFTCIFLCDVFINFIDNENVYNLHESKNFYNAYNLHDSIR